MGIEGKERKIDFGLDEALKMAIEMQKEAIRNAEKDNQEEKPAENNEE